MPRNREPIREPTSAEVSLAAGVRAIWRRAAPAIRSEVEGALADGRAPSTVAIREALLLSLGHPSVMRVVQRAARRIVGDLRRQVAALIPEGAEISVPEGAGQQVEAAWIAALLSELRELVVGEARLDDARADGRIRSILSRVVEAASSARATAASVMARGQRVVEVVARRVVSAARGLMGRANEAVQRAAGITSYTWITKSDDRVRPIHERLHGTVQLWSSPPVVNSKGRRGHPGYGENCRCVAVPIT